MSFEKPVVVMDIGSFSVKAGFSCDNHPVAMFRTAVGRPNYLQGSYGREPYEVYIGDDAMARIEDYEINHPVVNGRIVHWDNMERIFHHVFYKELKVAPEERDVLLACAVTMPMEEKIKCCEVFFETLNAPSICLQPQAVLALYGAGATTGLCVDLGHDTTDINPVYEGGLIKYAHIQTNLAGGQISDFIKMSLNERHYDFGVKSQIIIEDMKKSLYVTQDIAMPRWNWCRKFTLPSGEIINIGEEAFMGGEMYFQPNAVKGKQTRFLPLQDAVVNATLKCDSELQALMCETIVPCGGISMVPGLSYRLAIEVEKLTDKLVNVHISPESQTITWMGGATFASIPASKKLWVFKSQYYDYGEKIIRNKFM